MRGSRARMAGAAVVLLAGLTSGCLVEIDRVADPGAAFAQARREAARFQGRPGPAHTVNVLVYGHDDSQLVRVSVPMWLARKVAKHEGNFDADLGDGLLFASELKSLLEHPRCPNELDFEALARYLALEYVPTPYSILGGVRKLPGDVSASSRYWEEDIIEPAVTVSPRGTITPPNAPGIGYNVNLRLLDALTVRKETIT